MHRISRLRIYGFASIVFVGGLLIGACAAFWYCRSHPAASRWERPPRPEREARRDGDPGKRFAGRLAERYGLDAARQAEVSGVFQRFLEKMETLRGEFLPKMQATHAEFAEDLRQVLPPEVFAKWQEDQQHRFPGWRSGRPGVHPPHRMAPGDRPRPGEGGR